MAVRYIGTADVFPKFVGGDVVGANTGGTLAGSQVVQVVFDDTVFGATAEGKQRLVAALEIILSRIEKAHSWPIDSTS